MKGSWSKNVSLEQAADEAAADSERQDAEAKMTVEVSEDDEHSIVQDNQFGRPEVPPYVFERLDWLEPLLRGIEASGATSMHELADFFERAEEVPFVSGPVARPGMVAGWCGHAVAISEWRAGFRNCERCGH